MNLKNLKKQVETSKEFIEFKSNNPNNEFVAGFFILDFLENTTKQTLDYKTKDNIFTFELIENKIKLTEDKLLDIPNTPSLTKINQEPNIQIDEIKSRCGIQALDNGINSKFQKIIAVLQNLNDKLVYNCTCMLEQLIILNIILDAETGNIIKFERKSMMDMIKKK